MRLIIRLPAGSQLWESMGESPAWTTEAHMLAEIIDALHMGNWQRAGGKGSRPKPGKRPAELAAERDKAIRKQQQRNLDKRIARAAQKRLKEG